MKSLYVSTMTLYFFRYLRIQTTELPKASRSSVHRHKAIEKHPKPETLSVVREILSDRSDPDYPIFRNGDKLPDVVVTVAVGTIYSLLIA